MSCFPCFSSMRSKKKMKPEHGTPTKSPAGARSPAPSTPLSETKRVTPTVATPAPASPAVDVKKISAQAFNFRELAIATKNFKLESLLGEGGFGRAYKGTLKATGQLVAVKQLDRNAMNENRDFLGDVFILSNLKHPNLVSLVGYCADGDQRLLVYEFLTGGSVEERLQEKKEGREPMDWTTRMKIAYGAAQALEYLHTTPTPPIVYRDLKASSILLDEDSSPKLSDIGLEKLDGTSSDKLLGQTMMGMFGYSAPEYKRSNQLTAMSDVYSFGVVLLQLITGRKAVDTSKPNNEQSLVSWAQPLFRDPKRYPDMADPLLKKQFPERDLNQAVAMASMCLQEEAGARPLMSDVVTALGFLSMEPTIPPVLAAQATPTDEDHNSSSDISGNDQDETSTDSSEPKSKRSRSKSPSSSSRTSNSHNSSELAQAAIVYLHWQNYQNSAGHGSTSRKTNHSSASGSEADHPSREFTSFQYENSARWSHGGSADIGHDYSLRSHDTSG